MSLEMTFFVLFQVPSEVIMLTIAPFVLLVIYNLEEVTEVLLNELNGVTDWFYKNYTVLNTEKCQFMCLGKNTEIETFIFKDTVMNSSKEVKILGVNRQWID